jgi:hypothetical protein
VQPLQSGFTWVSNAVLNSITAVAQPNGAGQLCFVNQAGCEELTVESMLERRREALRK